jgi:hypothetical protein
MSFLKNRPKSGPTHFCQNLHITLTVEKVGEKFWATFSNAQRKQ